MITYHLGNDIDLDTMIELYRASTLGERRPIDERDTMRQMLENANLIVSAWDGDKLVGIARSLTDFVYATYLSDLAVHLDYQRHGIGKELIRETQRALKGGKVILLAAPAAREYYPHIGFTQHPSAWIVDVDSPIE